MEKKFKENDSVRLFCVLVVFPWYFNWGCFPMKWPQNATKTQVAHTEKSPRNSFLLNFFSIFRTVINDRYNRIHTLIFRVLRNLLQYVKIFSTPREIGPVICDFITVVLLLQ